MKIKKLYKCYWKCLGPSPLFDSFLFVTTRALPGTFTSFGISGLKSNLTFLVWGEKQFFGDVYRKHMNYNQCHQHIHLKFWSPWSKIRLKHVVFYLMSETWYNSSVSLRSFIYIIITLYARILKVFSTDNTLNA